MNTFVAEPQDALDDPTGDQLPGRPRNRILNRVTLPLLAVLVAAAGFLGGIEVEKGHGSTSASTASARFAGFGATASGSGRAGAARGGFGARSGTGTRSGGLPGGASAGGAPTGGFGGAGGGTTGTISSVSGRTIYLKETSGTTIKVTLTSATSLKKDLAVSRNLVRPGDEITVEGITGSGGSIKASSISDSGHLSTSSSASS